MGRARIYDDLRTLLVPAQAPMLIDLPLPAAGPQEIIGMRLQSSAPTETRFGSRDPWWREHVMQFVARAAPGAQARAIEMLSAIADRLVRITSPEVVGQSEVWRCEITGEPSYWRQDAQERSLAQLIVTMTIAAESGA